jgi:hypothetical protein
VTPCKITVLEIKITSYLIFILKIKRKKDEKINPEPHHLSLPGEEIYQGSI